MMTVEKPRAVGRTPPSWAQAARQSAAASRSHGLPDVARARMLSGMLRIYFGSLRGSVGAVLLTAVTTLCQGVEPIVNTSSSPHTNRLAKEKTPHLPQHQHNPVDLY